MTFGMNPSSVPLVLKSGEELVPLENAPDFMDEAHKPIDDDSDHFVVLIHGLGGAATHEHNVPNLITSSIQLIGAL